MNSKPFGKILIVTSLSVSLFLSGSMIMTPHSAHAASATASTTADSIIATGKQFMGVPYQYGAKSGRTDAFDCSSFVQYVYKQNGISLPRDSRQQSQVGTYVSKDQLRPGDLIFFYSPIHHVAIYIGNGQILHTYGKPGVTISSLSSWESRINTVRRVLPDNGQAVDAAPQQPAGSDQSVSADQPANPDTTATVPDASVDTEQTTNRKPAESQQRPTGSYSPEKKYAHKNFTRHSDSDAERAHECD